MNERDAGGSAKDNERGPATAKVNERSVSVDMRMCTGGERQCRGCQSIQVSREEVQGGHKSSTGYSRMIHVGHNAGSEWNS